MFDLCEKLSSEKEYVLYATINHYGNELKTGHYYNYIKIKDDWFRVSDDKKKRKVDIFKKTEDICILFYRLE